MSNTLIQRLAAAAAFLAPALAYSPVALAEWGLNMPQGVTELSQEIYDLHMLIFWICVAIAVVVFGAMFYSIFAFRKSKGAVADRTLLRSTKVEVIWTTIPILILVLMAIPAAKTLVKIEDTRSPDLTLKVTAYQWKWHYEYIDQGFGFFSNLDAASNRTRQVGSDIDPTTTEHYLRNVDKRVVLPVGAKVRILLTSNDVIHAWWVPELATKKDAIPYYINEAWFKIEEAGVYRGQCAELCGFDHGFMPIVVEAMEQGDFDAWVAQQQRAAGIPVTSPPVAAIAKPGAAGDALVSTAPAAAAH